MSSSRSDSSRSSRGAIELWVDRQRTTLVGVTVEPKDPEQRARLVEWLVGVFDEVERIIQGSHGEGESHD